MIRMTFRPVAFTVNVITSLSLLVAPLSSAMAQTASDERWYQVEVTVFAHNNAFIERELWPMEVLSEVLPRATRPLDSLMGILDLPDWSVLSPYSGEPEERTELAAPLQESDFRLPDFERDAFLALPASEQGFSDTNRALTAAGSYRVLYHNAWRQPMRNASQSVPVWIQGGGEYVLEGLPRHELEGTLVFRFNPGRDRVVLDARLWLSEFSSLAPEQTLKLPELPPSVTEKLNAAVEDISGRQWYLNAVIPVVSSREMRSNEFHYLDHPAVGIVVYVFPYEVPPQPLTPPSLF
ncbi:MAG TPA: CsiV family protein [Pseudohongiella sp.]|nr:CsiV family protein [Pseudohongiella sp.]